MRHTTLRRTATLTAALALAVSLTGCGDDDTSTDSAATSDAPSAAMLKVDKSLKSDLKDAGTAAELYVFDNPSAETFGADAQEVVDNFSAIGFRVDRGNEAAIAGGPAEGYCIRARSDNGSDPDGYFYYDGGYDAALMGLLDGPPSPTPPSGASDVCDGPFIALGDASPDMAAVDSGMKSNLKSAALAAEVYSTDNPTAPTFGPDEATIAKTFAASGFKATPGTRVEIAGGPSAGFCIRASNVKGTNPDGYYYYDSLSGGLLAGPPAEQVPDEASEVCDSPYALIN